MTAPAITLYMAEWCPYCQRAKALLARKNLTFNEINVDDDAKLRAEMVARSGRRTIPQIFIGDTHVGGCDDLVELERTGGLDNLIERQSGPGTGSNPSPG
jgi:glutaredoxin 3